MIFDFTKQEWPVLVYLIDADQLVKTKEVIVEKLTAVITEQPANEADLNG